MKYDYLVVGSGLYGAIFAHEANKRGKKVLVIDKRPNIAGNIYTEEVEGINVHKYGAHIFIQIIRKYGSISLSLQSSTDSQTHLLQTIRENFIHLHSTCIHSIRCGE